MREGGENITNKIQKSQRFETDQSIRIEESAKDTIVGIANNEDYFTVRIKSKIKRKLYERYRRSGKPKKFGPEVLAAAVVLALRSFPCQVNELVIDIEYPGHEFEMINLIKRFFPELIIYFGIIGKKSPAHYAAYGVHVKKREAMMELKFKDLEDIITKKTPELLHRRMIPTDSQSKRIIF